MQRTVWLVVVQVILLCRCWAQAPASGDELAPGAWGTRSGAPIQVATPATSANAWIQVSLALIIVGLGLRYGLPRLLRWVGKTGEGSPLDGQVRVIETRAVPNGSLMLVKARDRLLLIASSPQGMSLLADLTPPSEPPVPAPETAFDRVLSHASPFQPTPDPQQAVAEQVQGRIRQAREQLTRLTDFKPRSG